MLRTYAKALTFAALLILGTGAAASAAPSPKAQLDVMARSPVIQEEINTMYHTWDLILKSGNADRSMYRFYAVVTDLDRNGRLELLISNQYINKDPLFYAGEDISKEQRRGLTSLSNIFPGRIRGAAYEISADGTVLEPLEIQCGSAAFPDFTRIYLKSRKADAHPPYYVDTILMPRDLTMTKGRDCYPIVREAQHIRLDAGVLTVSTIARLEGTAGISDGMVDPLYTSMKLLPSGEDIDPYGAEAASFEREYRGGRRVTFVSWELLDKDPRAALAASWFGWTYEEE